MPPEDQLRAWDRLPIGGSPLQCRIAEAAVELFYGKGALGTTVRDITAACSLSPGALYNHFDSKEHLLYVLVRDIHRQVDAQMADVLATAGADPAAQLAAVVRLLVGHTAGSKKRSRVANREFTVLTGDWRSEIRSLRRQMRERLTTVLLTGAEQGQFRLVGGSGPDSVALSSATISNMCVHISEWTLESQTLTSADLEDRFAEMALRLAGAAR